MFIKILTKTYKGEKRYYASLVENKRINGKVVQTVKANPHDDLMERLLSARKK